MCFYFRTSFKSLLLSFKHSMCPCFSVLYFLLKEIFWCCATNWANISVAIIQNRFTALQNLVWFHLFLLWLAWNYVHQVISSLIIIRVPIWFAYLHIHAWTVPFLYRRVFLLILRMPSRYISYYWIQIELKLQFGIFLFTNNYQVINIWKKKLN